MITTTIVVSSRMERSQFDNKLSLPNLKKRRAALEDHNSQSRKDAKCRKPSRNDEVSHDDTMAKTIIKR
jgi:protein subunit release factor A